MGAFNVSVKIQIGCSTQLMPIAPHCEAILIKVNIKSITETAETHKNSFNILILMN